MEFEENRHHSDNVVTGILSKGWKAVSTDFGGLERFGHSRILTLRQPKCHHFSFSVSPSLPMLYLSPEIFGKAIKSTYVVILISAKLNFMFNFHQD